MTLDIFSVLLAILSFSGIHAVNNCNMTVSRSCIKIIDVQSPEIQQTFLITSNLLDAINFQTGITATLTVSAHFITIVKPL